MTPIEEMVLITGEWYYKREWPVLRARMYRANMYRYTF